MIIGKHWLGIRPEPTKTCLWLFQMNGNPEFQVKRMRFVDVILLIIVGAGEVPNPTWQYIQRRIFIQSPLKTGRGDQAQPEFVETFFTFQGFFTC